MSKADPDCSNLLTMPLALDGVPIKKQPLRDPQSLAFANRAAILLNSAGTVATAWDDMKGYMARAHAAGWHSSAHGNHVVYRCLARAKDRCKNTAKRSEAAVAGPLRKEVALEVSRSAAQSGTEFIAEVYAGARAGVAFSPQVLALYATLEGPTLVRSNPNHAPAGTPEGGQFTSGGGAGGSVDPSTFPRAEPGTLTAAQREVETRFAKQLAKSIPKAEAEYAKIDGTLGGKLLNTDLVRELSPDYRGDRSSLSAAVHEPASELTKQMYANRLAEPKVSGTVLFTAGGAGAGKSSGIGDVPQAAALQKMADIVYDTNMDKMGSATSKIEQALKSGRDVHIAYIGRDPVESLVKGSLPRAMKNGRTVPLAAHAANHEGAAKTIQAIAEKYKGDSRVQISYIDNTRGKGGAVLTDHTLPSKLDFSNLSSRLSDALDAEHAAGRISTTIFNGTKGKRH